jgi:hypothetical protein
MDIAAVAAERELGVPARIVTLDGELPLPSGAAARPALCQTDRGVWLVAGTGDESAIRAIARNPTCRYETRLVGDRLHVDGLVFGIPVGRGGEARAAIAAGRLLARSSPRSDRLPSGTFAESPGDLGDIWLSTTLAEDEIPLVWLLTSDSREVQSTLLRGDEATVRFLVTTHRQLLVAFNSVGDSQMLSLDPVGLGVEDGSGRCTVRCGSHSWKSTRSNVALYRRITTLTTMKPTARLRHLAALEWPARPAQSRALLTALADARTPLDRLIEGLQRDEPLAGPLRELDLNGAALLTALSPWNFPPLLLRSLAVAAVEQDPSEAARTLPLHRHARELELEKAAPTEACELDLALAEHLLLAEQKDEAASILKRRLARLPDESLSDLLPPPDADLSAGEAGQAHRIRCLELLAAATDETTWIAELARLQPLVPGRIERLVQSAEGTLKAQAESLLALHGSVSAAETDLPGEPRPLSQENLELVRHPAAREQGALGWLQGWVARQKVPDQQTLKDYCEPLNGRRHGPVVNAMTRAAVGLGTPGLEGFVSHGKLSVGLRVYDDDPPYVLVGGDHVHTDGHAPLSPGELAFALGTEVAHLRYGHTRVTDGEVWDGALDKVGRAIDLAATALAMGTPVGKVVGEAKPWKLLNSVFSTETLSRVQAIDGGSKAIQALTPELSTALGRTPKARHLGVDERELVVAHRVMQLTADRAGLLLCGDVRAALRALLATSAAGRAELVVAEQHGLRTALSRRGPDGDLVHQDLAIRVASLLRFFLSDEYRVLSEALYPSVSEPTSAS